MVIAVLRPLRVHLRDRTVDLHPGQPTELSEEEGSRLLAKKPDVVRVINDAGVWIECARKWDGSPLTAVYWDRNGKIVGPGQPEYFAKTPGGDGDENYWVIVAYQEALVWVRSDRLRAKPRKT